MGRSSDSQSSAPVLPIKLSFPRSISSPSNQLSSSLSSSSSSAAASTLFHRSTSPPRVNLRRSSSPCSSPSVHISLYRSLSPSRSISSVRDHHVVGKRQEMARRPAPAPMTCMCSPTTHPGSFRCNYHRKLRNRQSSSGHGHSGQSISCSPSQLNLRRSAMVHSLVRIGTVEGDLVKRALSALIRPSSHHQRRRADFHPRRSRLSIMSRAGDHAIAVN